MLKKNIVIEGIPVLLWGEEKSEIFIAVHGNQSSKEDIPIGILAEEAVALGYQVLSFDLPEHGDRKGEPTLCKAENCVSDLKKIFAFASARTNAISLWANSIGVYFSLLAYRYDSKRYCLPYWISASIDKNKNRVTISSWQYHHHVLHQYSTRRRKFTSR